MATYERIANLKGPRGHGIGNPRIVGDDLVVDVLDGTEKTGDAVVGNVRGPQGDRGEQGATGERGATGATPQVTATATTLPPGSAASVWVTGSAEEPVLELGIPRGDVGAEGPVGPRGPLPVVTATASTGAPGSEAEVTATPTGDGVGLAFRVPRGDVGAVPQLIFDPPLNLAPGSHPSVSVSTPAPGQYRLQLGLVQGPAGSASQSIRDDVVSSESSWSSSKTRDEIDAVIDDSVTGAVSGWSGQKVQQVADAAGAAAAAALIQAAPSASSVYSSERTDQLIAAALAAYVPAWSDVADKPATFPPASHSHGWGEVTGKPSTFTPAAHQHSGADIVSGTVPVARLPEASAAARGVVELATSSEAVAGTDSVRAVTPAGVRAAIEAGLVRSGTRSQRLAVSSPPEGLLWWQTDSPQGLWLRGAGDWWDLGALKAQVGVTMQPGSAINAGSPLTFVRAHTRAGFLHVEASVMFTSASPSTSTWHKIATLALPSAVGKRYLPGSGEASPMLFRLDDNGELFVQPKGASWQANLTAVLLL